jgi:5,10-methylenetetrahydrofolate reductase
MAYGGFHRMTSFCKTFVPKEVQDKVESLKDDDAGLKEYGVQMAVGMCQKILDAKVSPGEYLSRRVQPSHELEASSLCEESCR